MAAALEGPLPGVRAHEASDHRRGIAVGSLVACLLAMLAAHNILLWRFLGIATSAAYVLAGTGLVAIALLMRRPAGSGIDPHRIAWRTLATCVGIAALILILGGEGRLAYANPDWQVRDAVLRDMGRMAWPFAYPSPDGADSILRAPIGMYLVPALGAKLFGQPGGDIVLLVQNSLFLGSVLALGAPLFRTGARGKALLVVFVFSGLDIAGTQLVRALGGDPSLDHLESWIGLQYSSHVTLAFWVPQHALAGWTCAILYLLWRDRRIGCGALLAAVPLLALWSPLAIMGAVPFAVIAGVGSLADRSLRAADVVAPAIATALAVPALLYLSAGGQTVASGLEPIAPFALLVFLLIEVAPFAFPAILWGLRGRFGGATLIVAVLCLLWMPLYRIGVANDFQMRASIVPLALLAAAVADLIVDESPNMRAGRRFLILMLGLGAVTGASEVRRALVNRPAPVTRCSLIGSWDQQTGMVAPKSTYLAKVTDLPRMLRGTVAGRVAVDADPARCWEHPWRLAR